MKVYKIGNKDLIVVKGISGDNAKRISNHTNRLVVLLQENQSLETIDRKLAINILKKIK